MSLSAHLVVAPRTSMPAKKSSWKRSPAWRNRLVASSSRFQTQTKVHVLVKWTNPGACPGSLAQRLIDHHRAEIFSARLTPEVPICTLESVLVPIVGETLFWVATAATIATVADQAAVLQRHSAQRTTSTSISRNRPPNDIAGPAPRLNILANRCSCKRSRCLEESARRSSRITDLPWP